MKRKASSNLVTPKNAKRAANLILNLTKSAHKNFKSNAGGSKFGKSLRKLAKVSTRRRRGNNGSRFELVATESGGLTKSRYNLKYPKMKSINTKNCTKDCNRNVDGGGTISLQNRQNATTVTTLGDTTAIVNLWNSAIAVNGTYQSAAAINATSTDKKLWCDYQRAKITFTNQGASLMKITIYDVLCKVDNCTGPEESWDLGLQRQGGIDPSQEHTYHPGSSPLDSKIFRTNWKILNKKRVALGSGANHEHIFSHSYNGLYNFSKAYEFNQLTPTLSRNLRGMTLKTMVVCHGMPGDDENRGDAIGIVGLVPTKLIWCVERSYQTRIVDLKSTLTAYGNQLLLGLNLWQQNPDGQGIHSSITNIVEAVTANA
jgi:hypothetical protein